MKGEPSTDSEALAGAAALPQQALHPATMPERWVDEYGDFLFSYAMMRLRDFAAAQDAVQETFLAGLRQRESFRGASEERGWLLGILKHKIYDHFRRSARETPISSSELHDECESGLFVSSGLRQGAWLPEQLPSAWPANPGDSLDQESFWQAFYHCAGKLPRRTARAFLLREVDELDSPQICQLLGITEGNLWALLHRARLALRRCLEVNWFAKLK